MKSTAATDEAGFTMLLNTRVVAAIRVHESDTGGWSVTLELTSGGLCRIRSKREEVREWRLLDPVMQYLRERALEALGQDAALPPVFVVLRLHTKKG